MFSVGLHNRIHQFRFAFGKHVSQEHIRLRRFIIKQHKEKLSFHFMQEKGGAIFMLNLSVKQNGFQSMLSPEKPYISGFFGVFQI